MKRFVVWMLAVVMMTGMLSACGSKEEPVKDVPALPDIGTDCSYHWYHSFV